MNVIVVVHGMNVNVRVSEDPIEGIFTSNTKGALSHKQMPGIAAGL